MSCLRVLWSIGRPGPSDGRAREHGRSCQGSDFLSVVCPRDSIICECYNYFDSWVERIDVIRSDKKSHVPGSCVGLFLIFWSARTKSWGG